MLAKVYLLGRPPETERAACLAEIRSRLDADASALTALAADLDAAEVPDAARENHRFERATLDYGRAPTPWQCSGSTTWSSRDPRPDHRPGALAALAVLQILGAAGARPSAVCSGAGENACRRPGRGSRVSRPSPPTRSSPPCCSAARGCLARPGLHRRHRRDMGARRRARPEHGDQRSLRRPDRTRDDGADRGGAHGGRPCHRARLVTASLPRRGARGRHTSSTRSSTRTSRIRRGR